jgi:hypothetical protein
LAKVLALANGALVIIYSLAAQIIVPPFQELLRSMRIDSELPFISSIVYGTYPYWPILLVFPFVMYLAGRAESNPEEHETGLPQKLSIGLLVILVLWLPLAIWGLYQPIFIAGEGGSPSS